MSRFHVTANDGYLDGKDIDVVVYAKNKKEALKEANKTTGGIIKRWLKGIGEVQVEKLKKVM